MKKIALASFALAFPLVTSAQTITSIQSAGSFFITIVNNVAVPIVFALSFLVFIWGVYKYFIKGAASKDKAEGLNLMLYSLIGFFVMVSVWGLVRILVGSVNLDNSTPMFPQARQTSY